MKFDLQEKSIEELLLDPNNYRFLDLPQPQWRRRQSQRFHESAVQEAALRLLERTPQYKLAELRESILANGYVHLERIVVIWYEHAEDHYLIVEGNRRVAALKTLLRDHRQGVLTLTEEQIRNFSILPVAVLDPQEEGLIAAERVLMGIRHIAGPQEWGAYQQAYLILELVDEEGQSLDSIARHLGLTRIETGRRYRAIRALKTIEDDELYAGVAKPEFYRLFHELVSVPTVREYFSWDQESASFTDEERFRQFFELIAPLEPDSVAKLRTYRDVRDLRFIIGNPAAEATLLDQDQPLAAALARARPELGASPIADLSGEVRRFYEVLSDVQIEALTGLPLEDVTLLKELTNLIASRLDQYNRLTS